MDHNLYLDDSNVFIEGQRVYAARQKPGKPLSKDLDKSYRLDFGKLIEITCGFHSDLGKLMFYGSEPPPTDSVWRAAQQNTVSGIRFSNGLSTIRKRWLTHSLPWI